jgi:nitroimidazol reductase NimA-like FMN-containing flavoprotein (pyridoxamine 5'-phosphate oxidase superfamily)
MEKDPLMKRDEALSFLVAHTTGVLSTVSIANTPRSRTVYYTCDDSFCVYFTTLTSTRKVEDISHNPNAAFVVSESDSPQTLQLEGTLTDLTETATNDAITQDLMRTVMSNSRFGPPLDRLDPSIVRFYRFTPNWVRWGSFVFGQGTDAVLSLIDPAIDEEDDGV